MWLEMRRRSSPLHSWRSMSSMAPVGATRESLIEGPLPWVPGQASAGSSSGGLGGGKPEFGAAIRGRPLYEHGYQQLEQCRQRARQGETVCVHRDRSPGASDCEYFLRKFRSPQHPDDERAICLSERAVPVKDMICCLFTNAPFGA